MFLNTMVNFVRVTAVAVDPCQRQLASISHDSSLRVWNLDSLTQTYEVFSAGEVPTTLAYHPYKGRYSLLLV